jgi:NADH-ubiquinone oxidoreductase chain 5
MLFISIGLSQYNLALFHLFNHAYLKSLLFLGAGAIIHSMNDQQDIRKYGGLIRILPFSYIILLIGSLSLMALPYMSGFYSKDLIIETSYGYYTFSGIVIF